MLLLKQGQAAPLAVQLSDGNTALFCRATVLDAAGASLTTVTLAHVSGGLYVGSYTPSATGFQLIVYQLYTDAGFTTPATGYDIGVDQARVTVRDDDDAYTAAADAKNSADLANLAATNANTQATTAATQSTAANAAAQIIKKIQQNKWAIVGTQLVIYDDDGTTPFKTFNLFDDADVPSSTRIFKRVPV